MIRITLVILFLFYSLFAKELNTTLFNGTNEELEKIYTKELKDINSNKIKLSKDDKEQVEYQKILLNKLLKELNYQVKLEKVSDIENMDTFLDNIKKYRAIAYSINSLQKDIIGKKEKLETLKEKINDMSKEDGDLAIKSNQLLYALYHIENKNLKEEQTKLETLLTEYTNSFLNALKSTKLINNHKLKDTILNKEEQLKKLNKDEKSIILALDKALISKDKGLMNLNEKKLELSKKDKIKLVDDIVLIKIEELVVLLKQKKSEFFINFDKFKKFISLNLSDENFKPLLSLFKTLAKEHIGITRSTLADTKSNFLDVVEFTWEKISKPFIPLGENGISILDILKFLSIFIIGFILANFYKKRVNNISNTSIATKTLLANLGFYFLVFLTFVFALRTIGVDLTSLTVLIGALSVGIGFGLQNIVSNFISGIILIFEKSIQIDDIIELENGLKGKVSQINMRSSVITTFDNVDIIIPNGNLMQNNVTNLTFQNDIRRLHVPFGVAYGTDAKEVIKIVLDELKNSELVYINKDKTKIPTIWMTSMNASSVDFNLLVWVNANENKEGKKSSNMSEFLIFIYEVLNKHNIEIPFPQMDVHFKK
ncbi:MAG: hypothetical protein CSA86_05145 [Arcobacter sp.]|nr:MAG: hypothetical protein CSA86_05145 [Arcobacter sp.]